MKRFGNMILYMVFGIIMSTAISIPQWQFWVLLAILAIGQSYTAWSLHDDIKKKV
jgi:hypothetical protein